MTAHEKHIMRHAAFSFLSQWHQSDSVLMANIVLESDLEKRGAAFSKLATKYQVIRSFRIKAIRETKGEGEKGVSRRWQKIANSVDKVEIDKSDSPDELARKVHALAIRLGKIFPIADDSDDNLTLISAATKFLWFSGQTAIRIYDKRAVDALNKLTNSNPVNGNYQAYAKAWDAEFKSRKQMIKAAVEGSIENIDWSAIPEGDARTLAIEASKKEWFNDRVFDKFLWTLGAKSKTGDLSPADKVAQLSKLIPHIST